MMNIYTWTLIQHQKYLAFSTLGSQDFVALIHPALVVAFVFPMIGIVTNFAWQTRQRRLESKKGKSKIPAVVGRDHVRIGKWLSTSVVVSSLIAIAYSIVYKSFIKGKLWEKNNPQAILILLLFAATIASLVLLLQAKPPLWKGIFATMTGDGFNYSRSTGWRVAIVKRMVLVALLLWNFRIFVDVVFYCHCG